MIIDHEKLEAFYAGVSAAFVKGLGTADSQYEKIAMTVPSFTASNAYPWLGSLPSLREWIGDRVIKNLHAHAYTIENLPFEVTIAVKRAHVEDTQFEIYNPLFQDLGALAGIHPNRLVFGQLQKGHELPCYDGKSFFDAEHPVGKNRVANVLGDDSAAPWYLMCTTRPVKPLIFQKRQEYRLTRIDKGTDQSVFMRDEFLYGVDARVNVGFGLWQLAVRVTEPLTSDAYARARALMGSFVNDSGDPLGVTPDLLVVPPAHEGTGRRIVLNALDVSGGTNEWAGSANLLVCPWLA